jgi:hypothetical protein
MIVVLETEGGHALWMYYVQIEPAEGVAESLSYDDEILTIAPF